MIIKVDYRTMPGTAEPGIYTDVKVYNPLTEVRVATAPMRIDTGADISCLPLASWHFIRKSELLIRKSSEVRAMPTYNATLGLISADGSEVQITPPGGVLCVGRESPGLLGMDILKQCRFEMEYQIGMVSIVWMGV